MKAVIISCSEGNRLRPVTCSVPKAMLPVMGRPIIEHTVRLLKRHKITNITIAADYLCEEVKKHFASSVFDNLQLTFTSAQCPERFFAEDDTIFISDSIITDMDFTQFKSFFEKSCCNSVVIKPDVEEFEYGCVHVGDNSAVTSFMRCPDFSYPSGSAFMGIAAVKKGTRLCDCADLSALAEKHLQENIPLNAYAPKCYIKDISDFESYKKCCRDFMDKKISLPIPCDEKAPGVWIDENATVMQGSIIVPPVYIGRGSVIAKGARIEAYTQIGCDVTVDCFAGIKRSIIMDNSKIGEGACIRGSIIGKKCSFGFESAAYENSVIGTGTVLGKHCSIRTGVHIWPDKYIEDESTVSENLIWGSNSQRSLFSDGSASGIINLDITPEFAATLGRSAVCILGKKIAVSCDGSGAGTMIKNALISGIQSAGGNAYDLGEQPLPITRSAVRFYSLDGGIALSSSRRDGALFGSLDIINALGADIENSDLKKVEQLVSAASGRREIPEKIKDAEYLFEYKLYYLKQLINSTSKKAPGAKLLIHCPSLWATELLKSAAYDLKCEFTFCESADLQTLSERVKREDYDFGAICDYKCESLTLITRSGRILSEFDYCALTALIIMKTFPGALIYVPDSAPAGVDVMAEKYGATIKRTPISPPYLMNELSKSNRRLFLQQFIYRFDAVGAIILLLDFFYGRDTDPDALMSEIPPCHMISTNIVCSVKEQSQIIRELCRRHRIDVDNPGEAVKFAFDNGWVLIVPKRTESVINVISHGYSKEYAREIADIFTDEIAKNK